MRFHLDNKFTNLRYTVKRRAGGLYFLFTYTLRPVFELQRCPVVIEIEGYHMTTGLLFYYTVFLVWKKYVL